MRREYCPEDTSSSESDGSEKVLAIRREYCSEDTSSSVSLLHAVEFTIKPTILFELNKQIYMYKHWLLSELK